jgi:hypothetical protein
LAITRPFLNTYFDIKTVGLPRCARFVCVGFALVPDVVAAASARLLASNSIAAAPVLYQRFLSGFFFFFSGYGFRYDIEAQAGG